MWKKEVWFDCKSFYFLPILDTSENCNCKIPRHPIIWRAFFSFAENKRLQNWPWKAIKSGSRQIKHETRKLLESRKRKAFIHIVTHRKIDAHNKNRLGKSSYYRHLKRHEKNSKITHRKKCTEGPSLSHVLEQVLLSHIHCLWALSTFLHICSQCNCSKSKYW